jgi:hypothetical protein
MTGPLKAAVLCDRKIVAVSGTDRVKFLQGLTTNDIHRLAPDRALYAGFLTGQGKLLCDAFVFQDGDRILIDVAATFAEDFVKRLSAFKLRAAVEIGEAAPALAVAAVWGTGAPARMALEAAEGLAGSGTIAGAQCAFVDPRITALGARIVYSADFSIEAQLAQIGFAVVAAAEYTGHRLALGVADTAEIGGEVCYPLEANFEMLHGVDFRKGCYIGQELTARMKHKIELRKRILPISGATTLPTAGTPVTADGIALGPLISTSGTRGLALLRLDRLSDAKNDSIRAGNVPLTIHWPSWLPR